MTEPTLRLATSQDIPQLVEFAHSHLIEQETLGGLAKVSANNLDKFRDLIRSYLQGSLFGFSTVAELDGIPVGAGLYGEPLGPDYFENTLGRLIVVWLVWVAPEHRQSGLGLKLLLYGQPVALEMGFDMAVMGVRNGNPMGQGLTDAFGAALNERTFIFDLHKPGGQPQGEPHVR